VHGLRLLVWVLFFVYVIYLLPQTRLKFYSVSERLLEALQIRRLRDRDGSTPQQVQAILRAQAPRAARLKVADDVIHNDADMSAVQAQVAALHARYLELASQRRS